MTEKTAQHTLVTFVLDRSQSMSAIRGSTIEGFNGYLAGLKAGEAADRTFFSLVQFDSQGIDKVHVGAAVKVVPDLTTATFVPRGGTPLIEASVKTINAVTKSIAGRADSPQVVITILTDGEENQSGPEYTWDVLNALVTEKQAAGWQFNFLGAGIDAYQQAARMGISAAATMSYDSSSPVRTAAAFRSRGATTGLYAAGAVADMSFSAQEKLAAGDAFDPAKAPKVKPPSVFTPQSRAVPPVRGRHETLGDIDL